ncbi:MAG: sulfite exporter TauE/SafE family protein [Planctomycetota bacterium]
MTELVVAVFLASVLGSLHCVGMCGAFLALAFTDAPADGKWKLSTAYHGGRLTTYALFGAAAGGAGSLLDLAGALAGLSRVALPLAGLTVAGFGVVTWLRTRGVGVGRLRLPASWTRRVHRLQGAAMKLEPTPRALTIGLLTTLLPCGWLYAFVVTAAGTARPVYGGLVMAVFWAGTLPALVSCGVGVQALAGPVGRRLPGLTCLVLVAIGGWTVFGRAQLDTVAMASAVSSANDGVVLPTPACHGESVTVDPETGLIVEDPGKLCGHTETAVSP